MKTPTGALTRPSPPLTLNGGCYVQLVQRAAIIVEQKIDSQKKIVKISLRSTQSNGPVLLIINEEKKMFE